MIELDIPMGFIDFARLFASRGRPSLPLLPDIEAWLTASGISCSVSAPWGKSYIFATQGEETLFKLRWL